MGDFFCFVFCRMTSQMISTYRNKTGVVEYAAGGRKLLLSCTPQGSIVRTFLFHFALSGLRAKWLQWVTTVLRDHTFSAGPTFQNKCITEPLSIDNLPWQVTLLWPIGWSFKTGSTVPHLIRTWDHIRDVAFGERGNWILLVIAVAARLFGRIRACGECGIYLE